MRRIVAVGTLTALASAAVALPAHAKPPAPFVERSCETRDGTTLRYLLVLPSPLATREAREFTSRADAQREAKPSGGNTDARELTSRADAQREAKPSGGETEMGAEAPVLVALPPGNQTREMAEWALRTYWASEAQARGWVVASPIRPAGALLFNGNEGQFADLVDHLGKELKLRGGKVYLAGISNGGLSAFHAAVTHPERVRALVVLPGFPPAREDYERLARLRDVPVTMLVGERDNDWLPEMQRAERELAALGGTVTLRIMPGEHHVLRSLGDGKTLYDILAAAP